MAMSFNKNIFYGCALVLSLFFSTVVSAQDEFDLDLELALDEEMARSEAAAFSSPASEAPEAIDGQEKITFQGRDYIVKMKTLDDSQNFKAGFLPNEDVTNFSQRIVVHHHYHLGDMHSFVHDNKKFIEAMKDEGNHEATIHVYTAKDQVTKCVELIFEHKNFRQYDLIRVNVDDGTKFIKYSIREYKENMPEKTFQQFKEEKSALRNSLWRDLYASGHLL